MDTKMTDEKFSIYKKYPLAVGDEGTHTEVSLSSYVEFVRQLVNTDIGLGFVIADKMLIDLFDEYERLTEEIQELRDELTGYREHDNERWQ